MHCIYSICTVYVYWAVPLHSNSQHQDDFLFLVGNYHKASFATVTATGDNPRYIYIYIHIYIYKQDWPLTYLEQGLVGEDEWGCSTPITPCSCSWLWIGVCKCLGNVGISFRRLFGFDWLSCAPSEYIFWNDHAILLDFLKHLQSLKILKTGTLLEGLSNIPLTTHGL